MNKFLILLSVALATMTAAAQNHAPDNARPFSASQTIIPFKLEVPFNKTVHILFPSAIRYVDLGSNNIIAGKADGVENVVRVKAAVKNFKEQTNFSVITADGSFYSFMATYNEEPETYNYNIDHWLVSSGYKSAAGTQGNVISDLGEENPAIVWSILYTIHKKNSRDVRHLGIRQFGMEAVIKGIYCHNNLLFLHLSVTNNSNVPFDVDFIRFKVVDKKVAKRTAVQETYVDPVRCYNEAICIPGKSTERLVYVLNKMTLPDDKALTVEIYEKNGGRHMWFNIQNDDLIDARLLKELKRR